MHILVPCNYEATISVTMWVISPFRFVGNFGTLIIDIQLIPDVCWNGSLFSPLLTAHSHKTIVKFVITWSSVPETTSLYVSRLCRRGWGEQQAEKKDRRERRGTRRHNPAPFSPRPFQLEPVHRVETNAACNDLEKSPFQPTSYISSRHVKLNAPFPRDTSFYSVLIWISLFFKQKDA